MNDLDTSSHALRRAAFRRPSAPRTRAILWFLTLPLAAVLLAGSPAGAQEDGADAAAEQDAAAPCSTDDHRAFDYWVGTWDVYLADGRRAGSNEITLLYDGCALREQWEGASGTLGTSLTFYDAQRDVWHQTWVDNAGRPLYLEGAVDDDGVMELGSESERGIQKVRWIPLEDGRVRQLWQVSRDGGETWQSAFDGYYQPAGTPAPKPPEATEDGR